MMASFSGIAGAKRNVDLYGGTLTVYGKGNLIPWRIFIFLAVKHSVTGHGHTIDFGNDIAALEPRRRWPGCLR